MSGSGDEFNIHLSLSEMLQRQTSRRAMSFNLVTGSKVAYGLIPKTVMICSSGSGVISERAPTVTFKSALFLLCGKKSCFNEFVCFL